MKKGMYSFFEILLMIVAFPFVIIYYLLKAMK